MKPQKSKHYLHSEKNEQCPKCGRFCKDLSAHLTRHRA